VTTVPITTPAEGREASMDLPPDLLKARFAAFVAGERAAFPEVEYRPGHRIMAGKDNWRKFCSTATAEDLELLLRALEGVTA